MGLYLRQIWKKLNLTQQFGLTAGLVMIAGMLVIGFWVDEEIKRGVTLNAGTSAALYMDTYVSPIASELKDQDSLSIGPILALDEVFGAPLVAERVLAVRILKPDGVVVYADDLEIMGQKLDVSAGLATAAGGEVFAQYFARGERTEINGEPVEVPVLEIYSPIRMLWSGEIVAVLEFYQDASIVEASLSAARNRSWLLVGAVSFAMILALLGIVHSGSILIERQKNELHKRAKENARMAQRLERASGRSAQLSEQHLRRVSADLHDGPAQLISLAALRIGSLPLKKSDKKSAGELAAITGALDEAMGDIRDICRGLSLPEIENQSLSQIITNVTESHRMRTETEVEVEMEDVSVAFEPHEKICIYRFFQEGLNNAFRHGGGKDQRVKVMNMGGGNIGFEVSNAVDDVKSDARQGLDKTSGPEHGGLEYGGLGLLGLRERVEALGGEFGFECSLEKGARLHMVLSTGSKAG